MKLVVYSSQFIPGDISSADVLEDIRIISQDWNQRNEITGVLLFQNQTFLQALEGPDDKVDNLMQRLSSDCRHRNIDILVQLAIQHRYFPDWNMATIDLQNEALFAQDTLAKLIAAYRKNVRITDAGFITLIQSMLNNSGIEKIIN